MATTRLSVALLSLGLLLHCVSLKETAASDLLQPAATTTTAPPATTTAPPATTTAPPTTTTPAPAPTTTTPAPTTTTPAPATTTPAPTTTTPAPTTTTPAPATTTPAPTTTTPAPTTTTPAPATTTPAPTTTTPAPATTTPAPTTTTPAPTTTTPVPAAPTTPPAVAAPSTTTAAPSTPPAAPSTTSAAHATAVVAATASPSPSRTSAHTTADHQSPTPPAVTTTNPAATNALPTSAGPPTTTNVSAPGGGQSAGTASKTPDPQDKTTSDNKVRTTLGAVTTVKTSPSGGVKTNTFSFPSSEKPEHEDQILVFALCRKLMGSLAEAECTVTWTQQGEDVQVQSCLINVTGTVANQYLADIRKEKLVSNPGDKTTLIAILASCGALLAMIIGLGIYATHHRKPYHENQQHLTEELHTVENGYHDNPTLEVMEVQPEMQEKKKKPFCNEFDDSWIVPMETMAKEVLPEEEDTHL